MAKKQVIKEKRLEDILFDCRNQLRGRAAMTDKRDLLLTLVFLKFVGDRFEARKEEILSDPQYSQMPDDFKQMIVQKESFYKEKGIFFLTDECRWNALVEVEASKMAIAFDNAIAKLEQNEQKLKNALPQQIFTKTALEPKDLKAVVDSINMIDQKKFQEKDLIGRVYEYFLQAFSINADKEEGEFYTPHSIVELIASLIEPFDGTIYDPCCGSGGMFVQSAKFVEAHGGNTHNINVYGQESEPATFRLAKMNLAVRGISYHLGDRAVSTFSADQHADKKMDYIMANPPFNLKRWRGEDELTDDWRWKGYEVPPTSNANYAWILHMLAHLNPQKGVAGFLLANGALDDSDTLGIRSKLIENDKVEAIIVLPREMFYSTDISVTLWILNNNKKGGIWHGRQLRDRSGEILFMDLRTWNQNIYEKKFVQLSEEQIAKVVEIYQNWQSVGCPENYASPELYYSAKKEEIAQKNYSLVPSRYIEFVDKGTAISLDKALSVATDVVSSINKIQKEYLSKLNSVCDSILDMKSMKGEYPFKSLGNYIEICDQRNSNNKFTVSSVKGISIEKKIIDTKADMTGVSLKSYKVLRPNEFCFVPVTSRNGGKISIACNKTSETFIVSSSYEVFRLKKDTELLADYLYLWVRRPEFDRYARFNSWGSARESFSFDEMCRVKIPLPPIDVQQAIVNIYKSAQEAKKIAEEADKLSNEICPALIQHVIHC